MHETFEEWLVGATKLLNELQQKGIVAYKVDVDVGRLLESCQSQQRPLDGAARATYVTSRPAPET